MPSHRNSSASPTPQKTLIGPFSQIVTMDNLPPAGPIQDEKLQIVRHGALLLEQDLISRILTTEEFSSLKSASPSGVKFVPIRGPMVLLPGFIDIHTHICFSGSRADEYAMKLGGVSYQEIAKRGGGILNTVKATRQASLETLTELTVARARSLLHQGVTTLEIKSGYGLSVESELKILRAIAKARQAPDMPTIVPTCLAAHVKPPEFESHAEYLDHIVTDLLPLVKSEGLATRVDIFIEDGAFSPALAKKFLLQAKKMGFSLPIHADQFSSGGALVASQVEAVSADHLEATSDEGLEALKQKGVHACVLPGASLGLGIPFAPARKILDKGLSLVIASDWNPGSAPMGDLLTQAALLAVYQKLSVSETLAGITIRAAPALGYYDRGAIKPGFKADLVAFPCPSVTEILYRQGALKPQFVWKDGQLVD